MSLDPKILKSIIQSMYTSDHYTMDDLQPIVMKIVENCNTKKSRDEAILTLSGYLRKSQKNKKYYFNTSRKTPNDNYKKIIELCLDSITDDISENNAKIFVIKDADIAPIKSNTNTSVNIIEDESNKVSEEKTDDCEKKIILDTNVVSSDSSDYVDSDSDVKSKSEIIQTDKLDSNIPDEEDNKSTTLKNTVPIILLSYNDNKSKNVFEPTDAVHEVDEESNSDDSDSDDDIDSDELRKIQEKFINKYRKNHDKKKYKYPQDVKYTIKKRTEPEYGPVGSQWVNDVQLDDKYDDVLVKRAKQYDYLRSIPLPPQRSLAWFEMRRTRVTASDGGCVLGQSKYNKPYSFLLKKLVPQTFHSNRFCYHGKKHEMIATMIYEYRMNVMVEEFGLMPHTTIPILGASPDGICNRKKLDKRHASKFVGRMLEIKVPATRKIMMSGTIKGHICPIHYWIQVQLQLECCDLDECDFWQCTIEEYRSRDAFIKDTDGEEPFRSISTGYEKGCLIQLIPKKRIADTRDGKTYWPMVYENAQFIYPPRIEMTPLECDQWISSMLGKIPFMVLKEFKSDGETPNELYDCVLDKVIYWKLIASKNVTVLRDRQWFKESYPKFKQMWNYVLFFRKHVDKKQIFLDYVNSRSRKENNDIMAVVRKLYNSVSDHGDLIDEIKQTAAKKKKRELEKKKKPKFVKTNFSKKFNNEYMF